MTALLEWAIEQFKWRLDYALHEVPAASIALLHRQWKIAQGVDEDMPLSVIEEIDNAR